MKPIIRNIYVNIGIAVISLWVGGYTAFKALRFFYSTDPIQNVLGFFFLYMLIASLIALILLTLAGKLHPKKKAVSN